MSRYIYLADIGENWTVHHPEALRRLDAAGLTGWTLAGTDGAWAE